MIVLFKKDIIEAEEQKTFSTELPCTCRPNKLIIPSTSLVDDRLLIVGITLTPPGGLETWGPWFEAGRSVPAEFFSPKMHQNLDLDFVIPVVEAKTVLSVLVKNDQAGARSFVCSFEVVPFGDPAEEMFGPEGKSRHWPRT